MAGFVKAAGNASTCTQRTNTNFCLSNGLLGLPNSLRLRETNSSSRESTPFSLRPSQPAVHGGQEFDELPDGSGPLVSRRIMIANARQDTELFVKEAEYLMSFPVIGENGAERAEYMKSQLAEVKEKIYVDKMKARPVILVISLYGIKVSSGENIFMAHALKRISYATCDPDLCQFSFLAREPKAHGLVQYCHTFITKTPEEASELNCIVAQAFALARANKKADSEKEKPALTFHDMIQNQIEANKEQFEEDSRHKQDVLTAKLSQISTPHVDQISQQRKERRQKEQEELEQKTPTDRSKLKSQFSVDCPTTTTGFSASQTKAALTLNLDFLPDVDEQTFSSISRILEALNSGEMRTYGSPVTILKDTIDLHFRNGLSHGFDQSPLNASGDDDLISISPAGPLTLLCQATDHTKAFQASTSPLTADGFNLLSSKSSQKSTSHCSRGESQFTPKSSHEHTRSKVLQIRDFSTNCDIFPKSTVSEMNRTNGKSHENRDDFGKKNEEASDANLCEADWYKPGIPREVVLEMLTAQEPGAFVVRDSLTHPGCYALSMKLPTPDGCYSMDVAHYLITRTSRGTFKLKGLAKEWNSLTALVTHHTVMKELLPCLLIFSNGTMFKGHHQSIDDDDDETICH